MFRSLLAAAVLTVSSVAVQAAPADDLIDALGVPEMIEIMREEGIAYGDELSADMFSGGADLRWEQRLEQIYDAGKMRALMQDGFEEAIDAQHIPALIAFFESDLGKEVVELELGARRAMVSDEVEDAARETYRGLLNSEDGKLALVDAFIDANDLIEANVAGALNASLLFYRGLIDGGALDMGEEDILADVWGQEESTRSDTTEWLFAYMLMAYGPLEDEALMDYIEHSSTPQGLALNRALFAGFNKMYDEISYALGLAAAEQMKGRDL